MDGVWMFYISGLASCAAAGDNGLIRGAVLAGERAENYVMADIGCNGVGCAVSTDSSCDDLESQGNDMRLRRRND